MSVKEMAQRQSLNLSMIFIKEITKIKTIKIILYIKDLSCIP